MSGVDQVRWRVLRERADEMLARAENVDDDFARFAALAIALLDRHAVDAKGRCRYCRTYRRRWRRRPRRCLTLPVISWYLEQPMEMIQRIWPAEAAVFAIRPGSADP